MPQVDVIAAKTALCQDGRDLGRRTTCALLARLYHHAGEARRERQAIEKFTLWRDAAGAVDSAEIGEKRAGVLDGRNRRWIEKNELRGIGNTPRGEVEHQRRQVGSEDFRLRVRFKCRGLWFVPQPIADARLDAA